MTFVAAGTQQYLWGSNHATSKCGLTTTLPSNGALDAINSGGMDIVWPMHPMRPPVYIPRACGPDGF